MRQIVTFILGCLIACVAVMIAMELGGCARWSTGPATPAAFGLFADEQRAATVRVDVTCPNGSRWVGSGVIIDARHALTAGHVVGCDGVAGASVTLEDAAGGTHAASVEMYSGEHDGARLAIVGTFGEKPAAIQGIATADSLLCSSVAYPAREQHCGWVTSTGGKADRNVVHTAFTEGGNSGAGVYDTHGRLVCIVTRYTEGGGECASVGEWVRQ